MTSAPTVPDSRCNSVLRNDLESEYERKIEDDLMEEKDEEDEEMEMKTRPVHGHGRREIPHTPLTTVGEPVIVIGPVPTQANLDLLAMRYSDR